METASRSYDDGRGHSKVIQLEICQYALEDSLQFYLEELNSADFYR